ncbi:MAG: hypothetical protein ABJN42_20390 [Roseibium sp.]|uniref:hypothetical protein n=1 Tax=Roseibium sp. TaxID=1936156 RepID=UPI003298F15F
MKLMKNMGKVLGAAALVATMPAIASAQNVGEIATSLTGQTTNVATLVSVVAFVVGVGLAIAGLLKFRAHSANPNDPSNKMSTAFMLVFVGAAMVAIPATLGSGISTIFGDGADTTDANTGFTAIGSGG